MLHKFYCSSRSKNKKKGPTSKSGPFLFFIKSRAHYREAGFVGAGGGQVVLEASATQLDLRHQVIINWIFVTFFVDFYFPFFLVGPQTLKLKQLDFCDLFFVEF